MQSSKVVVITGSGRGIGATTAELFAEHGYAICLNYKSQAAPANELAEKLRSQGAKCIVVQADVAQEEDVVRLFEQVDKELGPVSVLVNNAGILKQQMRLEDMTAERINTILINNVTSAFLCAREAVKRMSFKYDGQGGCIINVSSGAAKTGSPNEYVDYAASKAAMDAMTRGLSLEVATQGIRVNGVRPGLIYTDMHADGGEPGRVDRLKEKIPMQRGGEPIEIAEAIYWLASDKASFATGTNIDLMGGL
ncbi:MAG: SDR family oxidoreductase [Marinomonas sp.]|uniref:SDR family oxidoreductase n=1 Tax=unclassified Marinomonas TaxID=196814 RepID=UPI0007AF8F42|nr:MULTISPECIES: SDR family oxidoreductase [unclassified Marinomonas]KZM38757.1 sugar dehydrogenase [Marinomonas sp. SBI8L]KZM43779.1 sugar dehydrogenase [Marinomonas sp. SBI22]